MDESRLEEEEGVMAADIEEMVTMKESTLVDFQQHVEDLEEQRRTKAAEYEQAKAKGDQIAMKRCRRALAAIDEEIIIQKDILGSVEQDLSSMRRDLAVQRVKETILPRYTSRKLEYQALQADLQRKLDNAVQAVNDLCAIAEQFCKIPSPVEELLSAARQLPSGQGVSLATVYGEGWCDDEQAENFRILRAEIESLGRPCVPAPGKVPDLVKMVDQLRESSLFTTMSWNQRLRSDGVPSSGRTSDRRGMVSSITRKVDPPDLDAQHDAKSGRYPSNSDEGQKQGSELWNWAK